MPRIIGEAELKVKIRDNRIGEDIEFSYRPPTTREREEYDNEAMRRKGRKVKFRHFAARLKFGAKIITRIGDGYLAKRVNGEPVLISSDPKSVGYDPEWKTHLVSTAPDMVALLAAYVFDGSGEIEDPEDAKDAKDAPADGQPAEDDAEKNLP